MTAEEIIHCQLDDCFFPSTSCNAGLMDAAQCPNYRHQPDQETSEVSPEDERFPWTERPFGLKDLRFVSAVRRPHVIGMAGLEDAGKTTLLGMLFLMLYRGHRVMERASFSGSYTLQGWENIARHLQLNSSGPIQFPPHTTRSGRFPGLLHLRFSTGHGSDRDYLLADAPGEWFSHWTVNVSADNAAGARWIAANADKIFIFADTKALTGPEMGLARSNLEFLIRRVQHNFRNDSVALLWSKTDIPRPKQLIASVDRHFKSCFPESPVYSVRIPDKNEDADETTLQALKDLFQWSFTSINTSAAVHWPESNNADPFLSYRGKQ